MGKVQEETTNVRGSCKGCCASPVDCWMQKKARVGLRARAPSHMQKRG